MESRSLPLTPGEPVPWFRGQVVGGRPSYVFDTVAGRYLLLLFMPSASDPAAAQALSLVERSRDLFDDVRACFFGVTPDPADETEGRVAQRLPGIRFFIDPARDITRGLGAEGRPHWLLVDPMLRTVGAFAIGDGDRALRVLAALVAAPLVPDWAPVLMAPNILEPALCKRLIALYEAQGGEASGFMREIDGKTTLLMDPEHKMRRDCMVEDPALVEMLKARVMLKLLPMVKRAFQFEATRMERYLVGCYEAGAGHFRPHRDNTTKGTAHRRFAVTVNLNPGDYSGGDLRFPEYGPRTYRAPLGGAVVFSCSLLHEATPVTRGKRYAFLPFLYDDAAARQREENNAHLAEGLGEYRGGVAAAPEEKKAP
jgi:predicted 2-oxoglutarate/Fe(II)-dependent dioxygenase YbiX